MRTFKASIKASIKSNACLRSVQFLDVHKLAKRNHANNHPKSSLMLASVVLDSVLNDSRFMEWFKSEMDCADYTDDERVEEESEYEPWSVLY